MILNRCPRCSMRAVLPDLLDGWLCFACGAIPERDPRLLAVLVAEATERQERQAEYGARRHAHRNPGRDLTERGAA